MSHFFVPGTVLSILYTLTHCIREEKTTDCKGRTSILKWKKNYEVNWNKKSLKLGIPHKEALILKPFSPIKKLKLPQWDLVHFGQSTSCSSFVASLHQAFPGVHGGPTHKAGIDASFGHAPDHKSLVFDSEIVQSPEPFSVGFNRNYRNILPFTHNW